MVCPREVKRCRAYFDSERSWHCSSSQSFLTVTLSSCPSVLPNREISGSILLLSCWIFCKSSGIGFGKSSTRTDPFRDCWDWSSSDQVGAAMAKMIDAAISSCFILRSLRCRIGPWVRAARRRACRQAAFHRAPCPPEVSLREACRQAAFRPARCLHGAFRPAGCHPEVFLQGRYRLAKCLREAFLLSGCYRAPTVV